MTSLPQHSWMIRKRTCKQFIAIKTIWCFHARECVWRARVVTGVSEFDPWYRYLVTPTTFSTGTNKPFGSDLKYGDLNLLNMLSSFWFWVSYSFKKLAPCLKLTTSLHVWFVESDVKQIYKRNRIFLKCSSNGSMSTLIFPNRCSGILVYMLSSF